MLTEKDMRFLFVAGKPLNEPVAWRGPIVMNTQEELEEAFRELGEGTFIKVARGWTLQGEFQASRDPEGAARRGRPCSAGRV